AENLSSPLRRGWSALLMCAAAIVALSVPAAGRAAPTSGREPPRSVVLAFAPARTADSLERELARAGLSVAVMSAAEGSYTNAQLVLDISQGARIASAAYSSSRP